MGPQGWQDRPGGWHLGAASGPIKPAGCWALVLWVSLARGVRMMPPRQSDPGCCFPKVFLLLSFSLDVALGLQGPSSQDWEILRGTRGPSSVGTEHQEPLSTSPSFQLQNRTPRQDLGAGPGGRGTFLLSDSQGGWLDPLPSDLVCLCAFGQKLPLFWGKGIFFSVFFFLWDVFLFGHEPVSEESRAGGEIFMERALRLVLSTLLAFN